MVFHGRVKDGRIVLEGDSVLPEGAAVTITLAEPARHEGGNGQSSTAYERLKPIVGIAKDLPPDAAKNVDHYLYGHPKK